MIKSLSLDRVVLIILLLCSLPNMLIAQSLDYNKAMNDIMSNYLSDYTTPTIKALDKLFSGKNVDELPAQTRFFYYYYYGCCLVNNTPDDAIKYFVQARNVAYSYQEVGIRNSYALVLCNT